MYNKVTLYINELILTPFSPFDSKKLSLIQKITGNLFLGHLGG